MAELRDLLMSGLAGPLGLATDVMEKLQPGGMPELEQSVFPDQFGILQDAVQMGQDEKEANRADAGGSIIKELGQAIGADLVSMAIPTTPQEVVGEKALDFLTGGGGALMGTLVSPQIVRKLSKGIKGEMPAMLRRRMGQNDEIISSIRTSHGADQDVSQFTRENTDILQQIDDLQTGVPRRMSMADDHDPIESIDELPETLFHVTTSKPGVEADKALMATTGGELGAQTGAGGAMFPGVSFTDNAPDALLLKKEMARLGKIHREVKKKDAFSNFIQKYAKEDADEFGQDVVDEAAEFAGGYFEEAIKREMAASQHGVLPASTIRQVQTNAYSKYLQTRGSNPVVLSGDLSEAVFEVIATPKSQLKKSFGDELPFISQHLDAVGNEIRFASDVPVDLETSRKIMADVIQEMRTSGVKREPGIRIPAKNDPDFEMTGGVFDIDEADEVANREFMETMGIEFPDQVPMLDLQESDDVLLEMLESLVGDL